MCSVAARRPQEVLDEVAERLGLTAPSAWEYFSVDQLEHGSKLEEETRELIGQHGGSTLRTLQAAYPETSFVEKIRTPAATWEEKAERRKLLEKVGRWHGVQSAAEWNRVTTQMAIDAGGAAVLKRYNNSLRAALADVFPENAEVMERGRKERGHWKDRANRRRFLDEVAEQLNVKSAEDWAKVTCPMVRSMGGGGLLNYFSGSLVDALQDAYPEEKEAFGIGRMARQGYWDSAEHRKEFLDDVAKEMGVTELRDWRRVRNADILRLGGRSLLDKYGGSLYKALRDAYGEAVTETETRSVMPNGFWAQPANCKAFLDDLRDELGISCVSDWRSVTVDMVRERGGAGILAVYPTFSAALQDNYREEFAADPVGALLARKQVPNEFWEDPENVRRFLTLVAPQLGVTKREDWGRVSQEQLRSVNGSGLLAKMSLVDALRLCYPKEDWDDMGGKASRAAQRHLMHKVRELAGIEFGA